MPKVDCIGLLLLLCISASPVSAQSSLYQGYGFIVWSEVPTIFAYSSEPACADGRKEHSIDAQSVGACTAIEFFEQLVPTGSIVQVSINTPSGQPTDGTATKTTAIASVGSGEDCQRVSQSQCLQAWLVWNPPSRVFPAPD